MLSAADVWLDVNCMHTTETDSELFLYPARHQIQNVTERAADAVPPAFSNLNGHWCNQENPTDCFTVGLPAAQFDGNDYVFYLYPDGQYDAPPDQLTYDNMNTQDGGCWLVALNSWPPGPGDGFAYCPAGTTIEWSGVVVDGDYDRVVTGQDSPYVYARTD